MSQPNNTFIARGTYNGGTITEIQMIVDTTGTKKFDNDQITGAVLNNIAGTSSSANPGIFYVKDTDTNVTTPPPTTEPLEANVYTAVTGGARKRSYKQKTQKRRQKKQQRGKSRRV
jgi:hypothetical protein